MFDDQLNQLIAGDEREEHACDGNDDRFGDIPHQGENPRRKARRGAPDLCGNVRHLPVDGIKHT